MDHATCVFELSSEARVDRTSSRWPSARGTCFRGVRIGTLLPGHCRRRGSYGFRAAVIAVFALAGVQAPNCFQLCQSAAYAQAPDPGEDAAFEKLKVDPSVPAIRDFLRQFPFGQHRDEANKLLEEHRELLAWEDAQDVNTREGYETYIDLYPTGKFVDESKRRMAVLEQSPEFIIQAETSLEGTISSQPDAPSANQCRSACAAENSCEGYDYSYDIKACNLYASIRQGRRREGYTAGTLSQIQIIAPPPPVVLAPAPAAPVILSPAPPPVRQPEPPPRFPSAFVELRGFDLPGADADLNIFRDVTFSICQDLCRADPRCRAYTYNTAKYVCFTKSRIVNVMPYPQAVSGYWPHEPVPLQQTTTPDFVEAPGVDFPGADLAFTEDVTYEQCQMMCRQDRRCSAYTYNVPSSACFTKSRVLRRVPFDGAVSGYR